MRKGWPESSRVAGVALVALAGLTFGCGGGDDDTASGGKARVDESAADGGAANGGGGEASGDDGDNGAAGPEDSDAPAREVDPCTLVPIADAEALVGPPVEPPVALEVTGAVGAQRDCTFIGGGFVQSAPRITVTTIAVKGAIWTTYEGAMARIYELTDVPDLGGAAVRWEDQSGVIGVGWWRDGTIVSVKMQHVVSGGQEVPATVDQLLELAGSIDARL
jgi:hypothetical protein